MGTVYPETTNPLLAGARLAPQDVERGGPGWKNDLHKAHKNKQKTNGLSLTNIPTCKLSTAPLGAVIDPACVGSICAAHATTVTAGLPGLGWLLPPPKMSSMESKPLGTRPV